MARTKRDFEESEDVRTVADAIWEAYEYLLEGVNLGDIYFALCTSKKADNAKDVIRKGISDPLSQKVGKRRYQIAFYASDWGNWTDAQKNLQLFEVLFSIDEDGKYKKPDVQGYYPIIKTLGPDWMDDPELVDILDKKVVFKERIPTAEDPGSSAGEKGSKDPFLADVVAEEQSKQKALK
jgi:hypothetical protein